MPKQLELASFPQMIRSARAWPMAHRVGGRTSDLYLSAQLQIESRLLMSIEIWGRQLTTRGVEIGVRKGGRFGCWK